MSDQAVEDPTTIDNTLPDHDPSVLEDNHAQFTITKPVNFVQLADEVKAKLGDSDTLNIQGQFSHPDNVVDARHPLLLLVGPSDQIDANAVNEAIEGHDPDPFYGDVADPDQREALHKVVRGENLSESETTLALQGLLDMSYYRRLNFTKPS